MKIRCMNCMKEYDDSQPGCPECGFVRGTLPKEIYHLHPEVVLADRYVIGTVVAYGGFGILYRAWDQKLEVMVAVKEYFPSSYVNRNPGETEIFIYTSKKQGEFQEGLEGFLAEARNTARFSKYPNIVNVYDYFRENGTAYMVMEYMDGITLKQRTKERGGSLPWQEAVEILTTICENLQVVHQAGILHRDISPDNIMLCNDGSVKLFDFGAARFSDMERDVTRTIILKIGFAPPEQYRAKSRQGPWTDVYALGATLYRTITGVLPDESVNRQEALLKEGKDTLKPPKELVPDLPDYLNTAICKAMAVQQELRFKDVLQLRDALLHKKQYLQIEKELQIRKRRRKLGIAALAILLTGGVAGCLTYYRNRQMETTLQGAKVNIWSSVKNGADVESQKRMLEEMTAEFCSDYPGVVVEITCIPEKEYKDRLTEAAVSGGFPVLYESVPETRLEGHQDELSEVLERIEGTDYYFLDQEHLGEAVYQLPLGMHWPVVYMNTLLQDTDAEPESRNDEAAFLNGDSLLMVSGTERYGTIQEELPGIYAVKPLDMDSIAAEYTWTWSVDAAAGQNDRNAARRILYYFLGETAQDILHVQNEGSLPLNRNEMDAYLEINQEFSFLKEQMDAGIPVEFTDSSDFQERLDEDYLKLITDDQALKALDE